MSAALMITGSLVDDRIPPFDVAQAAKTLTERFERRRVARCSWREHPNAPHLARLLLGPGDERRKNEAERENDREPDQPHGHLAGRRWSWTNS